MPAVIGTIANLIKGIIVKFELFSSTLAELVIDLARKNNAKSGVKIIDNTEDPITVKYAIT